MGGGGGATVVTAIVVLLDVVTTLEDDGTESSPATGGGSIGTGVVDVIVGDGVVARDDENVGDEEGVGMSDAMF